MTWLLLRRKKSKILLIIKAFHYINYNWPEMERYEYQGWKQASININSYITEKYVEEISKEKYLHVGDVDLLKDYSLYQ